MTSLILQKVYLDTIQMYTSFYLSLFLHFHSLLKLPVYCKYSYEYKDFPPQWIPKQCL